VHRSIHHSQLDHVEGAHSILSEIYTRKDALVRHLNAPLLKEREEFLSHLSRIGTGRLSMQNMAWWLLRIIKVLRLKRLRNVDISEIRSASRILARQDGSKGTGPGRPIAELFSYAATKWLRFHGRLKAPSHPRQGFSRQLEEFNQSMRARDFRSSTMETNTLRVAEFLNWFSRKHRRLSRLTILDVDHFLAYKLAMGSAPPTLKSISFSLRAFLSYAETRKWCAKGIASLARGPAVGRFSIRRQGRKWKEVRQLLQSIKGNGRSDLRAKAAIPLLSVYALRGGELAALLLEDVDWVKKTLTVRRFKRGKVQIYPLLPEIERALHKYITKARPHCSSPQLFVTIRPPYRKLNRHSVYHITHSRLERIGYRSGPRGPHSLRHASATRLLELGASLKQIGDFLGHRDHRSVLTYAKFDLKTLRKIAEIRLEGLL
jgi:integrase/recombinase XerD